MAKRYFWLKLKDDFFNQRAIKKLRKIAGGDTYTIIYLKLQLLALKNDGKIFYEGVEESFVAEMALELGEEEENVNVTIMYMIKNNLMEELAEDEFLLPEVLSNTGSETAVASRVREYRERQKALQCNTSVTKPLRRDRVRDREEIDKEIEIDNNKGEKNVVASALRNEIRLLLGNRNITVDNIFKLNKPIDRLREVFEFANDNDKFDGWIITCLRDNYDLSKQKKKFVSGAAERLRKLEEEENARAREEEC